MNCLKIDNLTKSYNKTIILENINLSMDSGKIIGLLGKNGAGKSTLMKCIVGLVKKDSGRIIFSNKGVNKFGYLIEYPAFYPNLSAFDNLKIFASILNVKDKRIAEIIEKVNLAKHSDKIFDNYSLGMKQRLGLARALLANPNLLILDEPFNGLDPSGIIEIRDLLKDLAKSGKSILVSSHNLPEIEKIADEINLLHNKKIVERIKMSEVQRYKRLIIKTKEPEKIKEILQKYKKELFYNVYQHTLIVEADGINSEEMIGLIYSNGATLSELYFEQTSLEEHFQEIVGGRNEEIK